MATGAMFSKTRLGRLKAVLGGYVEQGEIAGVTALVSRRGETHVEALGSQSLERKEPIRRETIFRIASMSKPITAAAAMILVEECKLRLDEPVDRLLPELANRRVLKRIDSALEDTESAARPLTLRDLLTFQMGYGRILAPPGLYPIQRASEQLGLEGLKPRSPHAPDEWIKRFGTLPLIYQPGERWLYHTGSDVLGVLIARASGQGFEAFLRERIFDPLGMRDTGFTVPTDKRDRFSSCYQFNPQSGALELYDDARESQWSTPPPFPSGGGGLVSTVDDYLAFSRMMLGKGRIGRERILSRAAVEAMVTDSLTPEQKARSEGFVPGFWDFHGWGFGVSPIVQRRGIGTVPGQFGWDGAFGTRWYCDPAEDLTAILMVQRPVFPIPPKILEDFSTLVYQAIED